MKKLFAVLLMLALMLPMLAVAEETAVEGSYYELSEDNHFLTVRLEGTDWVYDTTDPDAVELVTMSDMENDSWVASFYGTPGAGNVEMSFANGKETRLLMINVDEEGHISVVDVDTVSVEADGKLVVGLEGNPTTGYEWTCEIADETVVTCVEQEYIPDDADDEYELTDAEEMMVGVGGMYSFVFKAVENAEVTEDRATTITFRYARSWEEEIEDFVILDVIVDAEGNIDVVSE